MGGSDDVDAYLAGVPEQTRLALQELRETIKSLAPDAQERISYRIPVFFFHGMLVGFGANKAGCSFYTLRPRLIALLRDELGEFDASGGTVHFSPEHRLPKALVRSIVAIRLADNLGA